MLIFVISLYYPEAYHRLDHSICIAEYHRNYHHHHPLNPKFSPRLEPTQVFGFVTIIPVISSLKQFCSLHSSIVLSFRAKEIIFIGI
jgi:hypothetical protein